LKRNFEVVTGRALHVILNVCNACVTKKLPVSVGERFLHLRPLIFCLL